MSDDLNSKIKQIAEMLGQDSMPDNIKGLISLLASSASQGNPSEPPPKATELPLFNNEEKNTRTELDESLEMMTRIKKVMDKMNSANDPRINLLTAIKPFLSGKRQKKLSNCMKILMMSNMARMVDDFEKGV